MQILPPSKIYLLLCVFVFAIRALPAQITYTNVIPDITINNNGVYPLDLNNDSITDFNISYTNEFPGPCSDIAQLNYYIRITPTKINAIGNDNVIPSVPLRLDSNIIIDNNFLWKKNTDQLLFSMTWMCPSDYWIGTANGYWINTNSNFLPLKLRLLGVTYYGWLGIDVNGYQTSFGNFKIKEYAFNPIAAQPILAGEKTCSEALVTVAAGGPLAFCIGDSVILTATSNAYKYQWRKNGVNITGATSSTYTVTTAGTYKVKVTNSCGSKTSKCKIVTTPCRDGGDSPEGMAGNDALDQLSVFPNPAINAVTIHLPTDDESTVQIIDLFGEIVFSAKSTSEEMNVDLNKFTAGIYTARWMSIENAGAKTFSVIK